jgi:hypothetical protein
LHGVTRALISDEEAFRNGFHYFVEALRVLAAPPVQQCEAVGDYNVAWELKDDVLDGRYLLGRGFLSDSQEVAVSHLLQILEPIDVSRLPSGAGREQNLKAMCDPCWRPVRELASRVILELAGPIADTAAYFARGSHAT